METRHAGVSVCPDPRTESIEKDSFTSRTEAFGAALGRGPAWAGGPAGVLMDPPPGRSALGEVGGAAVQASGPQASAGAPDTVVGRIVERLVREVGRDRFDRFFDQQVRLRFEPGVDSPRLEVSVPSEYVAGLIGRRFGPILLLAAQECSPAGRAQVAFRVAPEAQCAPARSGPVSAPAPARPAVDRLHRAHRPACPPRYRLEDFLDGPCNQLALSAALSIADPDAGTPSCSPLFIHGPCGMGKTHLVQGLALRFKQRRPGASVRCTTGEAFTNEFIAAVRAGNIERFRRDYRRVDLLCIDDVHFLACKQATQAELLHTFDEIDLSGARVVLASDEHPRQIRSFSSALVSRFMSGLVAPLEPPDRLLCEKIIRRFALRHDLRFGDAAIRAIVLHTGAGPAPGPHAAGPPLHGRTGSIREIEGILTKVLAVIRLLPECAGPADADDGCHPGVRRVGMVAIRQALGLRDPSCDPGCRIDGARRPALPLRAEQIISHVCLALRVERDDFTGRGRHARVVLARSLVVFLCRTLTTQSFPEIARSMGRPNHSSVVTAFQRLKEQLKADLTVSLSPTDPGTALADLCDRFTADLLRSPAR